MNHKELLNSLRKGDQSVMKSFEGHPHLMNRLLAIAASPMAWKPGMQYELCNADGSVNQSSLGFKFAMQSTTLVLADVIRQKFYEEAIAKFASVLVGRGPWLDFIQQPMTFDAGGKFHEGDTNMASTSQIPTVDVGMSPLTFPLKGWNKGIRWSTPEVERALATNNWDLIKSRHVAVEKNWQLGIQEVGFVGNPNDLLNYPGLLSNTQVTVNTTFIPQPLSTMTSTELDDFVAGLIGLYRANTNETRFPNRLVVPMSDWTGLGVNVAISGASIAQTRMEYLMKAFVSICGKDFEILPTAYSNKARNAGWWAPGGTNRYALYNNDPETIHMDIPVQLQINAPATGNNYQWNAVGFGQYSGMNVYRVPEVMYFDDASSL